MKFVHELEDAEDLFRVIADEKRIDSYLVEKDYWIMHALWGLKKQGYDFELKGGTSLSKGFKIIDRFSEDIDIHICPNSENNVPTGKNQDKKTHIESRLKYFDYLSNEIKIPGMTAIRDNDFDNEKLMSAGIRLNYDSLFDVPNGIKERILLEAGFDNTTPNEVLNIDSWSYLKAFGIVPELIDNRAVAVKCYLPEYTFVEKLQTITRKVRQQRIRGEFMPNFLRHFYDIHQLFKQDRVKNFIGTEKYDLHKRDRFRGEDNSELKQNLAFNFDSDKTLFDEYKQMFDRVRALFISTPPSFEEIYASIIAIRNIG